MNKPRLKTVLTATVAVGALALLTWATLREPVQLVRTAQVTRGPLVQSFTEEGKTRVQARYLITSPVAGQLRRVTLQAGDAVTAGQVVAEIAPATAALLDAGTRQQAQAQALAADQQAASSRARISAADAADAQAQADWQRARELRTEGHVTQAYVDAARARATTTAAERNAARAEAQAAASRADAAHALLRAQGQPSGGPLALRAPVAGQVLRRQLESSTPVAPGQVLMEIGDPAQLEIEAEVLSTDAVRVAPGMAAQVLRWGGEGALAAHVTRVEPGGYTKVSALGVEEQRTRVVLALDAPRERWARLGDAYRVEVQFLTARADDALQVPASSLFRLSGAEGGWAVYRIEAGRAHKTPVTLGLRSASAAEVKSGLQAGQEVITQPDDRINEGTRIQAAGQ